MALTLALTIGLPAWGAAPEDKCEASKNQEAGRYAACLLKAEKGLLLGGDAAKHSKAVAKCDFRFVSKWLIFKIKFGLKNNTKQEIKIKI